MSGWWISVLFANAIAFALVADDLIDWVAAAYARPPLRWLAQAFHWLSWNTIERPFRRRR